MRVKYLHLTDAERPVADHIYANLTDGERDANPAIQALGFNLDSDLWRTVRADLDSEALAEKLFRRGRRDDSRLQ